MCSISEGALGKLYYTALLQWTAVIFWVLRHSLIEQGEDHGGHCSSFPPCSKKWLYAWWQCQADCCGQRGSHLAQGLKANTVVALTTTVISSMTYAYLHWANVNMP